MGNSLGFAACPSKNGDYTLKNTINAHQFLFIPVLPATVGQTPKR